MCKATNNLSVFNLSWSLARFGHSDNLRKVFVSVRSSLYMFPSRVSCSVSSKYSILVRSLWRGRNDTVRSENNWSIEGIELLFLLPPGITIVTNQVLILLQLWVVVSWKHFTMGVNINTCALGLLQKVFYILKIVTANQDTWLLTYTDIDLCKLWVSVDFRIGFVKQCHDINSEFACCEHTIEQCFHARIRVSNRIKRFTHEVDDSRTMLAKM